MDADFWHERWERDQTGWHRADVHPALEERWNELAIPAEEPVFVPLCGKSMDMVWLAQQGHPIIGSELSEIAVRDFFATLGLEPTVSHAGSATVFEAGPYQLWCGDFFELPATALDTVGAVYDRASLVALPADMRRAYAAHLASLLQPGTTSLVVTFVYDQTEMGGPPFSVPDDEVRTLFGPAFDVELLDTVDVLAHNPDLGARGLTSVHEELHVLRRRG